MEITNRIFIECLHDLMVKCRDVIFGENGLPFHIISNLVFDFGTTFRFIFNGILQLLSAYLAIISMHYVCLF